MLLRQMVKPGLIKSGDGWEQKPLMHLRGQGGAGRDATRLKPRASMPMQQIMIIHTIMRTHMM